MKIEFFENIINYSYSEAYLDNIYCLFKSIEHIYYLIYSNISKSIISYNLLENKKIIQINNAHNKYITNFRHYLDKIYKKDLLISISRDDNNIKLRDANNLNCLYDFRNIYKDGNIYSACFLNDNKENYILVSNYGIYESIKIFNLKGEKIKDLTNSYEMTYFIDTYYDNKASKYFIFTGNYGYVKSYDYKENEIIHKYIDKNNNAAHCSIIFNENNEEMQLTLYFILINNNIK